MRFEGTPRYEKIGNGTYGGEGIPGCEKIGEDIGGGEGKQGSEGIFVSDDV